ncbi:PREDICTED: salivary glue protein Sgs-3-like [Rhagoletis zephyria]|uniref:salivary glue protein Sgs-3-like n=1 Tax=Rhagoletis zephyria TaxID=28612 RepID=UPI0008116DCD|nr:PREDICTED: salivary glue protein Sgs-3-like [Rhagoletis zephyria]
MKNNRGKGDKLGVQVWVFLYWDYPNDLKPIHYTVTPPPDPDATTGPSTTAKPISTTTTVKPSPSSTTAQPSTTKPTSTTTGKPNTKTNTTTTKPTTKKSTSKPAPKTTLKPASKPTSPPKKTKKPHDQTTEPDTVLTETPEPVETTVLTTENADNTSSAKIDPNQE